MANLTNLRVKFVSQSVSHCGINEDAGGCLLVLANSNLNLPRHSKTKITSCAHADLFRMKQNNCNIYYLEQDPYNSSTNCMMAV